MSDFFKFMFCCGTNNEVIDFEEEEKKRNLKESNFIIGNINSNKIDDSVKIELDDKYYLPLEKEFLAPFTKGKLTKFINDLEDLPKGFQMLNTDNLKLYVNKDGSKLSRDTYIGCAIFSLEKRELYKDKCESRSEYTLEELSEFFVVPSLRTSWDKGVYEMKNISEVSKQDSDISTVIFHITFNSPIFGISRRDMVDKRIIFKKNKCLYYYQSSIEEKYGKELKPVEEDCVRAMTYINTNRVWEDETHYHMISFVQTDLRLFIPETFLQMAVPFTITKFYKAYVQIIKDNLKKEGLTP